MRRYLVALSLAVSLSGAAHAADTVDAAALMSDVRILSADDMQGRLVGSPGGAKARAYIKSRFGAMGLASIEQPFDVVRKGGAFVRGANLLVTVKGSASSGKVIVVTAHYDHLGVRDGQIYNGADDNASGVAALLALAAALRADPPKHTVILAALDGEEAGLRGARAFVAAPPVPRGEIGLNINLDMLSKNARNELYVSGASSQPALKPVLEAVAKTSPIALRLGHDTDADGKENNWTDQSDHFAFAEKGVPWVYFGVEDHPEYHKPTDDFATVPQRFFLGATQTVIAAVRAFDLDLDRITAAGPKP